MTQRFTLNAGGRERLLVLANAHATLDGLSPNQSWRIEIKRARRERTDPQNAALFGLAYPLLSEHLGEPVDILHEYFCGRFFGTVDHDLFGERHTRPFRTTTRNEHGERDVMSAADFAEFYAMVQRVAAEAGVQIPDPDPLYNDARFVR